MSVIFFNFVSVNTMFMMLMCMSMMMYTFLHTEIKQRIEKDILNCLLII